MKTPQAELERFDQDFMNLALEAAKAASLRGEIPVGAVLVDFGSVGPSPDEVFPQVIATSANLKESNNDPLGHAEIRVIRESAEKLGRWRLTGCTLYVTLEPCVMCSGAIVHARVDRVVYGARDPKAGAAESLYQILSDSRLNHRPEVRAGVLADECGQILTEFFAAKRRKHD
jgi:tRNA(adenine34) deaminase